MLATDKCVGKAPAMLATNKCVGKAFQLHMTAHCRLPKPNVQLNKAWQGERDTVMKTMILMGHLTPRELSTRYIHM